MVSGMAGKAVKSIAKAVGEYHTHDRARIRKEVLLAGGDWEFDLEKKEMNTKRKGHKVDRLAAEKRENIVRLMEEMPKMLDGQRKRMWETKMKEEEDALKKALNK
ncbi:tyrosine sulfotransferase-like protein [Perilla frutescens var. hirtella]|nr:tyrosine sulfotransferase-like protein [Perilla frutescens var. hirtella]